MHRLLEHYAKMLREAARIQAGTPLVTGQDKPEGVLLVQLSDTLAKLMARHLELMAAECRGHGASHWALPDELEQAVGDLYQQD